MTTREITIAMNSGTEKKEIVTPDFARELLKKNTMNRKMNPNRVAVYADEMTNGNWAYNGESIIIAKNGRVLDGQHRLHAVVESGVTVVFLIAYGVDEKTFDSMNQGCKRTTGQILQLEGHANGTLMASTVRCLHNYYENGSMRVQTQRAFTPRQHKMYQAKLKGIEHSVVYAFNHKRPLFTHTMIAGLHYIFSKIDKNDAIHFMNAIITGDHQGDIDLLNLRNFFIDKKFQGMVFNRNRQWVCGVLIKGWNAWRNGTTLRKFEYEDGEQFPIAI